MVTYLLDTDTLVYHLRGDPGVTRRLSERKDAVLATTTLNLAELYFGAYSSGRPHHNAAAVDRLRDRLHVFTPGTRAAVLYGRLKADLRRSGNLIGEIDLLIGACCLAAGSTLVTNNLRHFSRIRGIRLERWTDAADDERKEP